MQIDLTAAEYRSLLDILHLADMVMSGHRREPDPRTALHRAVIQKLYSHCRGEGLERLVAYDEHAQAFAPTNAFERTTPVHALLQEFEDHLFWDQLISRLTERDTIQAPRGGNAPTDTERRQREEQIRQQYTTEFSAHGIANLAVVERFLSDNGAPRTSD